MMVKIKGGTPMDKLLNTAQVILPIFAMVFLGIFSRRKGILTQEDNKGLQQLVMKFGMPCVLFNSTLTASIGPEAALSMVMIPPLFILTSVLAFRIRKTRVPYHNFPMLFAAQETGMLGIPLFMTLFGAAEAYRMGVLDLAQAVISISVITILATDLGENPSPTVIAGKVLRSPFLIMSVLGLALNLSGAADWLDRVGVLPLILGTTEFISQPVSAVMLFSVGYSFSLEGQEKDLIFRICAVRLAVFTVFALVTQGILSLLPQVDTLTRWAALLYAALPASYIAPTLARKPEEATLASGVCSITTVITLAVFCVIAAITA